MKVVDLIAEESRWIFGVDACDAEGNPLGALDDAATCWCLTGGVRYCYPDPVQAGVAIARLAASILTLYGPQLDRLSQDPPGPAVAPYDIVVNFNDNEAQTTFADIRRVLVHADV